MMEARCALCGCRVHRGGDYAKPTVRGRSHATRHHYVAERFFGRSPNRRGTKRKSIFSVCPWGREGESAVFCYECHEELLHNPVLLPEDIAGLARLVRSKGLSEEAKTGDRTAIAGRVCLFREVIAAGIKAVLRTGGGSGKATAGREPKKRNP